MTGNDFSGVFAATLTPYDRAGRVDAEGVARLATRLAGEGLAGICPAGTTGEFPLLDREEKRVVLRAACEAAAGRMRVIAGVWGATEAERSWLAGEAEAAGAAAVFLTTPYFFPATPEYLLEWYRKVRKAVSVPVFAYSIPQFTANEIPLEVLDTLAREGTIAGYKDSSPDPARLRAAAGLLQGRIPVFAGHESLFAEARRTGVSGFISGVANVFPRTVAAVWRGDAEAGRRLEEMQAVVGRSGGVAALKYLLELRGFPAGAAREPVAPVTAAGRSELERLERAYGSGL